MATSGFCIFCKVIRDISNPQSIIFGGQPATTGTCPVCGTVIYSATRAPITPADQPPELGS